ncbi:MAG: formyltransferase family protein [Candidatus Aquilonibacter sp.]
MSSTNLVNLVVELDERFGNDAAAREHLARAGYDVHVGPGASDPVLAWIDEEFGGAWSGEVAVAQRALATRDGKPAGFAAFDPRGLRYAWLRGVAREPGVGIFGPIGVEEGHRGIGPQLLQIALCGLRERGYQRALIAATSDALVPYYARHAGAQVIERYDRAQFTPEPVRTVVLASGSGTNFQSVIDGVADGLPLELVALVSNKADARAIERARRAGIPAVALPWLRSEQSRERYDAQLSDAVEQYNPELVLLLGWMHLLDPSFVAAFPDMLNVHPSFLPLDPARDIVGMPDGSMIPAYRGPHAVRDALAAGSPWVGASVHEVTVETDRGRVLARKPLRVHAGEDEAGLLARLHPIEHKVVATAVKRWLYERG